MKYLQNFSSNHSTHRQNEDRILTTETILCCRRPSQDNELTFPFLFQLIIRRGGKISILHIQYASAVLLQTQAVCCWCCRAVTRHPHLQLLFIFEL